MRTKKTGKNFMIIKIDLEKAYDRLSWAFIKDTLEKADLPNNWVCNIMKCVDTG